MLTKRLHITARQNASGFNYLGNGVLLCLCVILYLHLIFMFPRNFSLPRVNERQNKCKQLILLETLLLNNIAHFILSNKRQITCHSVFSYMEINYKKRFSNPIIFWTSSSQVNKSDTNEQEQLRIHNPISKDFMEVMQDFLWVEKP